jgi:hypothetical protein
MLGVYLQRSGVLLAATGLRLRLLGAAPRPAR